MIKNVMENTRRIYCNIGSYDLIFSKATHLINCTCQAEAWNSPCWHKRKFYDWLYDNDKLTSPRVIAWIERERCKI